MKLNLNWTWMMGPPPGWLVQGVTAAILSTYSIPQRRMMIGSCKQISRSLVSRAGRSDSTWWEKKSKTLCNRAPAVWIKRFFGNFDSDELVAHLQPIIPSFLWVDWLAGRPTRCRLPCLWSGSSFWLARRTTTSNTALNSGSGDENTPSVSYKCVKSTGSELAD